MIALSKESDESKNSLLFGITYDDEKVGFIILSKKQDNKLCWGEAIKEGYQGKGIATKAFELAKQKAKEEGYTLIISSCSSGNVASKKLHEKCGFKLIQTEINQAGNEMHRWEIQI